MNMTVARIVDLVFADVEMSDEVHEIYDEVMNNCQEHFQDMVDQGVSEDDAIGAITKSLSGMSEMLKQYPQKQKYDAEPPMDEENEEDDEQERIYAAADVREIAIQILNDDVEISRSRDSRVHVRWERQELPTLKVSLVNGTLTIERDKSLDGARIDINRNMSPNEIRDNVDKYINKNMTLNEIGNRIGKLIGRFGQMISSIGSYEITIELPEDLHAAISVTGTNGDVDISAVYPSQLYVKTVNSDIDVNLPQGNMPLTLLTLQNTSGDIDAEAYAEKCVVNTVSGDIDLNGRMDMLTIHTTSGDIDLEAEVETLECRTVSGDVDGTLTSLALRQVNVSTISGDVDLSLPEDCGPICFQCRSRSGDCHTCHTTVDDAAPINGSITTISGDIDIR